MSLPLKEGEVNEDEYQSYKKVLAPLVHGFYKKMVLNRIDTVRTLMKKKQNFLSILEEKKVQYGIRVAVQIPPIENQLKTVLLLPSSGTKLPVIAPPLKGVPFELNQISTSSTMSSYLNFQSGPFLKIWEYEYEDRLQWKALEQDCNFVLKDWWDVVVSLEQLAFCVSRTPMVSILPDPAPVNKGRMDKLCFILEQAIKDEDGPEIVQLVRCP